MNCAGQCIINIKVASMSVANLRLRKVSFFDQFIQHLGSRLRSVLRGRPFGFPDIAKQSDSFSGNRGCTITPLKPKCDINLGISRRRPGQVVNKLPPLFGPIDRMDTSQTAFVCGTFKYMQAVQVNWMIPVGFLLTLHPHCF